MSIWQLDPLDKGHPNWRTSTYDGRVIIRCADAFGARRIARLSFTIAVEKTHIGETIPEPPWPLEGYVKCQQLTDSEYDEDGPDAILDPAEYNEPWRYE